MALHSLDGTIVEIGQEQTWPSGFAKVVAIIAEGGSDRESDQIPVEFTRSARGGVDGIALLGGCEIGDRVRVAYELRGREWEGRHFLNLSATNLQRLAAAPTAPTASEPAQTPQTSQPQPAGNALDLPFTEPAPAQQPAPSVGTDPALDDLPF